MQSCLSASLWMCTLCSFGLLLFDCNLQVETKYGPAVAEKGCLLPKYGHAADSTWKLHHALSIWIASVKRDQLYWDIFSAIEIAWYQEVIVTFSLSYTILFIISRQCQPAEPWRGFRGWPPPLSAPRSLTRSTSWRRRASLLGPTNFRLFYLATCSPTYTRSSYGLIYLFRCASISCTDDRTWLTHSLTHRNWRLAIFACLTVLAPPL